MHRRRTTAAIVAICAVLGAGSAGAQAVTGLGDDATLAPAGSIRLKIQSDWSYQDQLFVSPIPGAPGVLRPVGARFTLDSLGVAQLPILKPFQDSLRAITGNQNLSVTLGQTYASVVNRVTTVPISIEAGISRFLSVTAVVPIVNTRSSVFFRANQVTSVANLSANPAGTDPTARATDSMLTNQMIASASAVQSYCSGGGAADPRCSGYASLVTSAKGLGNSLSNLYTYGLLVPTRGSSIQSAVDLRIATVRNALNAFASNPASGVPYVSATGVVSAPFPLATPVLQALLTNAPYGVGLDPLQTVDRTHIGDAELSAKLLLFDSFNTRDNSRFAPSGVNARLSVGGGYRFPTGALPSANSLTDLPSGTHIAAILLRGYGDLSLGRHFWLSGIGRFVKSSGDSLSIRFAPGVAFPSASSVIGVSRQTGNLFELEALPRWVFNDFVSIGGDYLYRHKPADTFTNGGVPVPDLGAGTDYTETRIGGGIVFSNVHAVSQGKSSVPFDVSYMHTETINGSGGAVPKLISEQISIRLYFRLRRLK